MRNCSTPVPCENRFVKNLTNPVPLEEIKASILVSVPWASKIAGLKVDEQNA